MREHSKSAINVREVGHGRVYESGALGFWRGMDEKAPNSARSGARKVVRRVPDDPHFLWVIGLTSKPMYPIEGYRYELQSVRVIAAVRSDFRVEEVGEAKRCDLDGGIRRQVPSEQGLAYARGRSKTFKQGNHSRKNPAMLTQLSLSSGQRLLGSRHRCREDPIDVVVGQ